LSTKQGRCAVCVGTAKCYPGFMLAVAVLSSCLLSVSVQAGGRWLFAKALTLTAANQAPSVLVVARFCNPLAFNNHTSAARAHFTEGRAVSAVTTSQHKIQHGRYLPAVLQASAPASAAVHTSQLGRCAATDSALSQLCTQKTPPLLPKTSSVVAGCHDCSYGCPSSKAA
jgi:hypothetical protein